ncbi:MAG: DUF2752 domain-containing protein [Phycisphaerales bacterium]|nr:DUF2752 domain-containing protein [Phycisphaerales bacterium]
MRRRVAAGLMLLFGGVVLLTLAVRHPDTVSWAPICLWREATGTLCAGCGTGRGMHHLLQGDLMAAWRLNPLMLLLGIPAAAIVGLGEGVVLVAGRRIRWPAWPSWLGWTLLAVVVGWWVGRNL